MRHVREHRWWLAACSGGLALAVLVGGFVGPTVAVFAIVYLAGGVLIACESGDTNRSAEADRESVPENTDEPIMEGNSND
ncbi:MAG: hypothetical protein ACOYB7_10045 [Mycobacterium sp.]